MTGDVRKIRELPAGLTTPCFCEFKGKVWVLAANYHEAVQRIKAEEKAAAQCLSEVRDNFTRQADQLTKLRAALLWLYESARGQLSRNDVFLDADGMRAARAILAETEEAR